MYLTNKFNKDHTISITVLENNFKLLPTNKLNSIRVFDVESEPKVITIFNFATTMNHYNFFYNSETKVRSFYRKNNLI